MDSKQQAEDLIKNLDEIDKEFKINQPLFMMLYMGFKAIEDDSQITNYLIEHNEIDIDTIKRTKYLFHQIIYHYTLLGFDVHSVKESTIDKAFSISETLKQFADEQQKVMKLPTLDELRKLNATQKE